MSTAENSQGGTSVPPKYGYPQTGTNYNNGDVKVPGKGISSNISHAPNQPFGLSTSPLYPDMGNQGRGISSKYSNIKPAISIKPKPVPLGVSTTSKSVATNFNMNSKSTLKSDISLNINTSKKWVLPPRPRPGRKPTATQEDSGYDSSCSPISNVPAPAKQNKNNGKKKVKIGIDEGIKVECCQTDANDPDVRNSIGNIAPATLSTEQPDPNQVIDLKMNYLSKLKEQEMIRNYIDVINNQIKELRFVQNGVITFNALNSDNDIKPQLTSQTSTLTAKEMTQPKSAMSQYEQLEKINNLNDLNKFLAYLTRSSNIIHSATKKFMGDNNTEGHLNNQIQNYLDMRAMYKSNRTQEQRKIDKNRQDKNAIPLTGNKQNIATKNGFIPSLLKPLNQNIESQDEISVNVVEEDQNFSNQSDFLDKLIIRDEIEEDIIRSNEVIQEFDEVGKPIASKGASLKKLKSFSCGFCTNDSCLCLDTEMELTRLKK